MSNDIWKSSTLTLITAVAAITACGLQPSLHVESASIRNVEGSMALAMTRPLRLSVAPSAPALPIQPESALSANDKASEQQPAPSEPVTSSN